MNKEEYIEIDNYNLSEMLFNRDERLIEIIKGLREERDYIFNKLTCEKGYLQEILDKKEDKISKVMEYCEEITSREIDISDTDYDLGQDFTARDILKILRGEE